MMGYQRQWMLADPVAVNGFCAHFVWQVSMTPIIVDPTAVAVAQCERALNEFMLWMVGEDKKAQKDMDVDCDREKVEYFLCSTQKKTFRKVDILFFQ